MAVFNVIEHVELSSAVATWTSGTFATSYDHLFITMSARLDSGYNSAGYWRFNGDTGNNYSMTDLQSYNASSVGTYYSASNDGIGFPPFSGSSSTANTFGSLKMWIPNYANTSYFKPVLITSGAESMTTTSSQYAVKRTAGLYRSTSAITSFNVHINGGHDFVQYSSYTVYGVNGA
jgi:hypothetical protein